MKLAAACLDCLRNQYVCAAGKRPVSDQGARFVNDRVNCLGELLFNVPAGPEHVPAEVDDRRGPDRGQQLLALCVGDIEALSDQRDLPGGR